MGRRLSLPSLLQWRLLARRGDLLLFAATLVCLVAAALQWGVAPVMERQTRALRGRLYDAVVKEAAPPRLSLTDERLRAFRERLADDVDGTEALKRVFAEATAAGITLQQGDYSWLADTEGGFAKLQVSLPVKGTYPQIRAYTERLLQAIPALSLDEIGFRRDSIKTPTVEARLRLTLYLRGRGPS